MALKDPTVWRYSQYYSIVFGGYVALSLWMTKYYISEYGFEIQRQPAGRRLQHTGGRAARHRRLVLRQVGAHAVTWWVMWIGLVCLFFLSYPQTDFVVRP